MDAKTYVVRIMVLQYIQRTPSFSEVFFCRDDDPCPLGGCKIKAGLPLIEVQVVSENLKSLYLGETLGILLPELLETG